MSIFHIICCCNAVSNSSTLRNITYTCLLILEKPAVACDTLVGAIVTEKLDALMESLFAYITDVWV